MQKLPDDLEKQLPLELQAVAAYIECERDGEGKFIQIS
jgi:hypothetical protein